MVMGRRVRGEGEVDDSDEGAGGTRADGGHGLDVPTEEPVDEGDVVHAHVE